MGNACSLAIYTNVCGLVCTSYNFKIYIIMKKDFVIIYVGGKQLSYV